MTPIGQPCTCEPMTWLYFVFVQSAFVFVVCVDLDPHLRVAATAAAAAAAAAAGGKAPAVSPGSPAGLAALAAAKHPGVGHFVAAPIGLHPLMVDIVDSRLETCLKRLTGGGAFACTVVLSFRVVRNARRLTNPETFCLPSFRR